MSSRNHQITEGGFASNHPLRDKRNATVSNPTNAVGNKTPTNINILGANNGLAVKQARKNNDRYGKV